jgi:uncharacterized membrane protein
MSFIADSLGYCEKVRTLLTQSAWTDLPFFTKKSFSLVKYFILRCKRNHIFKIGITSCLNKHNKYKIRTNISHFYLILIGRLLIIIIIIIIIITRIF